MTDLAQKLFDGLEKDERCDLVKALFLAAIPIKDENAAFLEDKDTLTIYYFGFTYCINITVEEIE